jgi:hypothetical protein
MRAETETDQVTSGIDRVLVSPCDSGSQSVTKGCKELSVRRLGQIPLRCALPTHRCTECYSSTATRLRVWSISSACRSRCSLATPSQTGEIMLCSMSTHGAAMFQAEAEHGVCVQATSLG